MELEILNLPRLRKDDRQSDAGFQEPKPLRRKTRKRVYLHGMHIDNAAQMITRLPEPEESIHCVIRGTFHAWDFVPAVLKLAQPARIKRLDIATLSFSNSNAEELISLMDSGQIAAVTFICSGYYSRMNAVLFEDVQTQIQSRGGRVNALPSHAKVTCLELTDGRHITIEGSANLRSCRNIEQCVLTNDQKLLLFHRQWMEELAAAGWKEIPNARKKADPHRPQDRARKPRKAKAPGQ